jgi:hypothetical protein
MKDKTKQSPKDIYAWCCDYEDYRGEGRLARCFVEYVVKKNNNKFYIKTPYYFHEINNQNIRRTILKKKKEINLNYFNKYITPFMGIFWLWKNFLLKRKIAYINFNPLWNICVFIFSPPGTIFGPITGNIYEGNVRNIDQFIRAYLFPFLYKISIYFLGIRKKKLLFSTSLLKKVLSKKIINNSIFDFQIIYYNSIIKKSHTVSKVKKNIDLIFYNRQHNQKKNLTTLKMLKLMSNNNQYKNIVIGNNLPLKNFLNLKIIEHKQVLFLLSKSRYTFFSPENYLSMFLLEALSRNVKIFIDKEHRGIRDYFVSSNFIFLDFSNEQKLLKKIIFHLNFNSKIKKTKLKRNIVKNLNNKIDYYLKEF